MFLLLYCSWQMKFSYDYINSCLKLLLKSLNFILSDMFSFIQLTMFFLSILIQRKHHSHPIHSSQEKTKVLLYSSSIQLMCVQAKLICNFISGGLYFMTYFTIHIQAILYLNVLLNQHELKNKRATIIHLFRCVLASL